MFGHFRIRMENWRKFSSQYPIVWLSYKRRIWLDIERVFSTASGEAFFDDKYQEKLSDAVRDLERWQLRLLGMQTALLGFLVVGFLSSESTITIFEISVADKPGVKELLAALLSTTSLLIFIVTASKDMRLFILEKLVRLKTSPEVLDFALVSSRSSFHTQVYLAKAFNDFIFPTVLTRALFVLLATLFAILTIAALLGSIMLQFHLLLLIHNSPSLGIWSNLAVWYVIATFILGLLWLIRLHVRLPFRDLRARRGGIPYN